MAVIPRHFVLSKSKVDTQERISSRLKCSSPSVQRGSNGNEGGGESGETCVCLLRREGQEEGWAESSDCRRVTTP